MTIKLLVFFLSTLFIVSSIYSQEGPDVIIAEFEFKEEDVIQIATKRVETTTETPAIVSVVSYEQIRAMGARSLFDVLRTLPGIGGYYTANGYQEISIRGIKTPPDILLMVDGHRVNDFYNGIALFDIPIENIQRVEVIRGPGSALYGTNAFVGVINVVTQRDVDDVQIGLKGGIFEKGDIRNKVKQDLLYGLDKKNPIMDSFNGSILGGYNFKKSSIKLSSFIYFLNTDGPKVLVEKDSHSDDLYGLTPGNTVDWKKQYLFSVYASKDKIFGRKDKIYIDFKRFNRHKGPYITSGGTGDAGSTLAPDTDIGTTIYLASVNYESPFIKNSTINSRVYFDQQRWDNQLQDKPDNYKNLNTNSTFPDGLLRRIKYKATTFGMEAGSEVSIFSKDHTITFGGQLENSKLSDYEYLRNAQWTGQGWLYKGTLGNYDNDPYNQNNRTRTVYAFYAQDRLTIKKSIGFVLGLRYDNYSDFGSTTNRRGGMVLQFKELFKNTPYFLKPVGGLTVKFLYGEAFRAPTFYDLYNKPTTPWGGFIGKTSLKPETIKTLELGIEYNIKKYFSGRYSIFQNKINNRIDYISYKGGGGIDDVDNYKGTKLEGNEAELKLRLDSSNYIYFTYSTTIGTAFFDSIHQETKDLIDNAPLNNIPSYFSTMGININPFQAVQNFIEINNKVLLALFNFHLYIIFTGERSQDGIGGMQRTYEYRFNLEPQKEINLALTLSLKSFQLMFTSYNLLNTDLCESAPLYYNFYVGENRNVIRLPKRSFELEARYKF